jgi:hypothetical protein
MQNPDGYMREAYLHKLEVRIALNAEHEQESRR